jgi:hypothetical protein
MLMLSLPVVAVLAVAAACWIGCSANRPAGIRWSRSAGSPRASRPR